MTNVLIVDDSRVARSYMQSVVNDSPDYAIWWVFSPVRIWRTLRAGATLWIWF